MPFYVSFAEEDDSRCSGSEKWAVLPDTTRPTTACTRLGAMRLQFGRVGFASGVVVQRGFIGRRAERVMRDVGRKHIFNSRFNYTLKELVMLSATQRIVASLGTAIFIGSGIGLLILDKQLNWLLGGWTSVFVALDAAILGLGAWIVAAIESRNQPRDLGWIIWSIAGAVLTITLFAPVWFSQVALVVGFIYCILGVAIYRQRRYKWLTGAIAFISGAIIHASILAVVVSNLWLKKPPF